MLKKQFQSQLTKFSEEILSLDPYTIYGLSLRSEFTIAVRIVMEPSFLSTHEQAEREIPVIIRSKWDGNHI